MRYLFLLLLSIRCFAGDPRVIDIYTKDEAQGTAFSVIAPSGKIYLITNAHICGNDNELFTKENGITHANVIIKLYKKADLCVLLSDFTSGFEIAKSYYKDESIVVIGYPEGKRAELKGNIISFDQIDTPERGFFISVSADCKEGSSGSPVLDSQNKVVGVIALVPDGLNSKSEGFAVPGIYLQDALLDL